MYLKNPLENALNNIKRLRPETTNECDDLIRLVQQNTYKPRGEKTTVTYTKSIPVQKSKTGVVQDQKKIVRSGNGTTTNTNVKNSEKTKKTKEIVYEEVSEEIYEDVDDDDDDDDDYDNNNGYQQFAKISAQNVAAKKPVRK